MMGRLSNDKDNLARVSRIVLCLAAGAADVAATTVELALVMALVVLWGLSRRPASLLPGGAVDGSVTGAGPLAWRGEQILVLGGVSVIVATSVALMALLITRPPRRRLA